MDKNQQTSEENQSSFKRFLQLLRLIPQPDATEILEQEIQDLIEEGEEQGLISSQEGQMISSIFEFRDTLTREIMTPTAEIISAPITASQCEIIKIIKDKGFSRIPIYEDNPDNIIGILHAKQLLTCSVDAPLPPLIDLLNPPFFVRENDKIVTLLHVFQSQKNHMAIVTDEFGSIRGLITLEDILEEIVGEIDDETDKQIEEWQVVDAGTVITSAREDIERLEEFFGIDFPEGPYESIGGFIINQLDRIPENREIIHYDSLTFTVLSATKRHIRTVRVHRNTDMENSPSTSKSGTL
ncbi:MAG: hemolysin family protein [Desulfobulbaceae bacterium]|nr:hemolysin family protein [Desulfobulbaceae bacterium]